VFRPVRHCEERELRSIPDSSAQHWIASLKLAMTAESFRRDSRLPHEYLITPSSFQIRPRNTGLLR
jgi:hypothetical protein